MEYYKILLDDEYEIIIEENILISIPFIHNLIEIKSDKVTYDNIINLKNINGQIFNHIITLIKFNKVNEEAQCDIFNSNFIKNMDIDSLIDFILITHYLNLEKYNSLAIQRFMLIFKNRSVVEIRKEFNIKNDFSNTDKKIIVNMNDNLEKESKN